MGSDSGSDDDDDDKILCYLTWVPVTLSTCFLEHVARTCS